MTAISGQPAPKPSSLGAPIPGKSAEDEANAFMSQYHAPAAPAAPVQAQGQAATSPQDEAAQFMSGLGDSGPAPQSQQAEPTQQANTFLGMNTDIKQQLEDLPTRIQANLAGDPVSVMLTLQKKFGRENVRISGKDGTDGISFRPPGDKKWHSLSPAGFEIVNDLYADNYRTMIGTLGAVGGGIGGTAAGGPIGGIAGGIGGYATGVMAADEYGTKRGVVKDPNIMKDELNAVNNPTEGKIQGDVGTVDAQDLLRLLPANSSAQEFGIKLQNALIEGLAFEAGGRAIEAGAKKILGPILAKVSEWGAERLAGSAGKTTSLTTAEVADAAKGISDSADALAQAGINLKQGKLVLSPGQIAGDLSPEAKSLDFNLSDKGPVRDFFIKQGEMVSDGFNKLMQGITNVTGKPAEELFSAVKGASKTSREIEGATIEKFRRDAIRLSNGEPQPMLNVHNMIDPYYGEMGFSRSLDGKLLKPDFEHLQEMFPDANSYVLGKMSNLIGDLETQLRKGQGYMPMAETNRIYSSFRDAIDNWIGKGANDQVARKLIPLKNALRDDFSGQAGSILGKERPLAAGDYQAAMQKYSELMSAQESMRNVLKKSDLSAAAFADNIFSPAQGKEKIGHIKALINETDSTLWPQLVQQQFSLMQGRATDNVTGRIDWGKLSGQYAKLEQYGILDQMVKPEEKILLNNFFNVAKNVDSSFAFKEGEPIQTSLKSKVTTVARLATDVIKLKWGELLATETVAGIGKNAALAKWLDGEGMSLVVKDFPPSQQAKVQGFLSRVVAQAKENAIPMALRSQGNNDIQMRLRSGALMSGAASQMNQNPGQTMNQQVNEVRKGTPSQ